VAPGKAWHHVVEQSKIWKFGVRKIQNPKNVVALRAQTNTALNALYSSKRPSITGSNSLTVREWLAGKSFEFNRKFGLEGHPESASRYMVMTLDELVAEFAQSVREQTEAIARGDAKLGNQYADRYVRAWERLRQPGNEGRDALARLLNDDRRDVQVAAAAYLLKYRTDDAKRVLQELAKGTGLAAFEASQALQRWEEGDWHLDD
jgi:hypothetical protein